MATATLARQSTAIPRSFTEALKEGWRITSENSQSVRGMRCGSVILSKGEHRVSVFYFADRDGYRFGSVKAVC